MDHPSQLRANGVRLVLLYFLQEAVFKEKQKYQQRKPAPPKAAHVMTKPDIYD